MNPEDRVPDKGRPAGPCAVVIFGASGDLTKRKLLPALHNLHGHGLLPKDLAVVGVARKPLSDAAFREQAGSDLRRFATTAVDGTAWAAFEPRLHYVGGSFEDPATYQALAAKLAAVEEAQGTRGNVLFYLATPPQSFAPIARRLGEAGLVTETGERWRRVIVEKPFGRDLESALALNAELRSVLSERQIYRIDHYLGKETVQNLMVLRFANGVLEPVWNRNFVDHVQILVAESIGIEGRGSYYESAGLVRDMVQNHILQLLALVAMEPPSSFSARDVRDEKAKVLRAVRPLAPEQVIEHAVRGQYAKGEVEGQAVAGYRDEPDVAASSSVETHAALQLSVDNWRWAGVPFFLRSGKRLKLRRTRIVVQFRRAPHLLFTHTSVDQIEPNRLVVHVQPNEGVTLELQAKLPGPAIRTQAVRLDFDYRDFGGHSAGTGYETLLYDCMVGDSTLFHRADMVEASWEIVTPILDTWAALKPRDFPNYAAGSWGPEAATRLIERTGRRWIDPS